MKYLSSILLVLKLTSLLSAQANTVQISKDTLFYRTENGFIVRSDTAKAEGFGFLSDFNPNQYSQKILFLHTETVMAEFECYDKTYMNKKTNVSSTMTVKNGRYEEWYISGEKKLAYFYTEDEIDVEFKTFHQNGKVKRFEIWKKGEWQSGDCFDENGNKIAYCSYQEQAEFKGGLSEMFSFLGNELKYPKYARKNSIEGTVYVGFVVEMDGTLQDISVKKGVEKHLDEEAVRIVKAMPKWKPGRFEGGVVRYKYTLPIKFKLE
jgi:TonB family protein